MELTWTSLPRDNDHDGIYDPLLATLPQLECGSRLYLYFKISASFSKRRDQELGNDNAIYDLDR